MNRRNFLQALAAMPLLGAIPAAAAPQSFAMNVKRDYVDAGEWSMVLEFESWDSVVYIYSPPSQPSEPKLGEYSLAWHELS